MTFPPGNGMQAINTLAVVLLLIVGSNQLECLDNGCCWSPGGVSSPLYSQIHLHTSSLQDGPSCFFETPMYIVKSISNTTLGKRVCAMWKEISESNGSVYSCHADDLS